MLIKNGIIIVIIKKIELFLHIYKYLTQICIQVLGITIKKLNDQFTHKNWLISAKNYGTKKQHK